MRHLTLTDADKTAILNDFTRFLTANTKKDTKSISYSINLNNTRKDMPKAKLYITTTAYCKMMLYVRDTSTEIAWHGVSSRNGNTYLIQDVMLYPQTLSGATVTTDQVEYNKWAETELSDEEYNTMRFQGHSHVNFAVTPSGTDMNYYNDILSTLGKNDYYIFMIMNKSGDMTFIIYDLASNTIYDTEDVELEIIDENNNGILRIIKQEKEKYCKQYQASYNKYKYDETWFSKYKQKQDDYDKTKIYEYDEDLTDEIDKYYEEKYYKNKQSIYPTPKKSVKIIKK